MGASMISDYYASPPLLLCTVQTPSGLCTYFPWPSGKETLNACPILHDEENLSSARSTLEEQSASVHCFGPTARGLRSPSCSLLSALSLSPHPQEAHSSKTPSFLIACTRGGPIRHLHPRWRMAMGFSTSRTTKGSLFHRPVASLYLVPLTPYLSGETEPGSSG